MMFVLITIVHLVLLLYVFFVWKNKYWQNKNIPYVEPKIFYGSIKEAIKKEKHFAVLFREWYRY